MADSSEFRFPARPDRLDLSDHEVHVVRFRLDETSDVPIEVLDDNERERARRFVFERDRRRFVVAHAWVRVILGRCLAQPPERLRFATTPHGKPLLVDAPNVKFNLSHAGERALLAVTLERDVGIDIEQERPIEALELAGRFFASTETAALQAVAPSEQIRAFFRCWTRKEAFIKALGDGLSFPLQSFEVSVADDTSMQLLLACTAIPDALRRWRIVSLESEQGYASALAAERGDWTITRWDASAHARQGSMASRSARRVRAARK